MCFLGRPYSSSSDDIISTGRYYRFLSACMLAWRLDSTLLYILNLRYSLSCFSLSLAIWMSSFEIAYFVSGSGEGLKSGNFGFSCGGYFCFFEDSGCFFIELRLPYFPYLVFLLVPRLSFILLLRSESGDILIERYEPCREFAMS